MIDPQSAMPSPQNREAALFQAAAALTGAERTAFLNGACLGDGALRVRLEALLAAHDAPDELAPAPAVPPTIKLELADAPDEAVGQTLGRYKLLERLGEGGCGVVYVAEQTQPVRRRVALKVIKLGMDTKQVVARFEAERQALAMMDHPNIAKVLDAGTTETGRPFFVMELVRGIRITDYCDKNNLTTRERLDLFIKVCQAIQHAHQKGIIHRDIKPSNILVTLHDGVPVPKVIDFGIAKATEGRLTDATVYTQLHQFIGTPAYMSPEQAEMSGLDIDTRSDIYSLGVLLYELLAGSTPFDGQELMSKGIDQMRKTIREQEPVRPSTRFATLQGEDLTTTAKRRSTDRAKLMLQLKGDLDWIVMKCLEKDRTRRYDTANGLASELHRYLNNEPVLARPPSAVYKFQKAFRRNKLLYTAAAAVTAALVLGLVAATWQSVRATRAKSEALAAQQLAVRAQAGETVQRQQAEASERHALAAQAGETKLRQLAEKNELSARRRAYAADMKAAAQSLAGNNLGNTLDLLDLQRPQNGQTDLRGWEWRYLWQQSRGDPRVTLGQSVAMESLAVSPDARWLAVGAAHMDGLFLWDLQRRQPVAHLTPTEGRIRAAFSPVEPLLAYTTHLVLPGGSKVRTLHFWNTATRQETAQYPLDNECAGLLFSQDGRVLVTSTHQGHITLWRVADGTQLVAYPCDQSGADLATRFAASADLGLAAYVTRPGQLIVLELSTGRQLWSLPGTNAFISALAFSPDGKTLAAAILFVASNGVTQSYIQLSEAATGKEIGRLQGHKSWVGSLIYWPDGKKLASASADQTIRVWDPTSGQCLDILRGHRHEVCRLALLPDNQTLVSGSQDGELCLWEVATPHPPRESLTIANQLANWQFAPDGRSLVTLDRSGLVTRWSGPGFSDQAPLLDLRFFPNRNCFSADGLRLAVHNTNGIIRVWDLARRELACEFKPGDGHNGWVEPDLFLAQGKRVLGYSSADLRLFAWDLANNQQVQSWPAPVRFFTMALAPDEQSGVAIGEDGDVIALNLPDQSTSKLSLDLMDGQFVEYSPDGRHLAGASALGYARVWDTSNWTEQVTLRGYLNNIWEVHFSPDGQRLATSGHNPEGLLKLWDVNSWQEVFSLAGTGSCVQFSRDGNTVGAINDDGTLHLWRAPSWAEINAAESKAPAETR